MNWHWHARPGRQRKQRDQSSDQSQQNLYVWPILCVHPKKNNRGNVVDMIPYGLVRFGHWIDIFQQRNGKIGKFGQAGQQANVVAS